MFRLSAPVVKDSYGEMTDEMPLGASIPFERTDEEDSYKYLFDGDPEGMGVLVSPCSLLRVRIER